MLFVSVVVQHVLWPLFPLRQPVRLALNTHAHLNEIDMLCDRAAQLAQSRSTPAFMAGRRGTDMARRDLMRLLQGGNMVLREAMKLQVRIASLSRECAAKLATQAISIVISFERRRRHPRQEIMLTLSLRMRPRLCAPFRSSCGHRTPQNRAPQQQAMTASVVMSPAGPLRGERLPMIHELNLMHWQHP